MKKTFLIITSLIMLCIMIVGCQTTDATISTSNELNKHLNLLSNTVSRLDTVDNEYLVSNELYTINSSKVPSQKRIHKNILARTNDNNNINDTKLEAKRISLNEDLRQALSNELINRIYCDSNGNCKLCNEKFVCNDNNMCNSCNQTIICDNNGNCISCGDILSLDQDNNCGSCKTKCISKTTNNNISEETKSCLRKISANNKDLKAELISTDNISEPLDDNNPIIVDNDNNIIDINSDITDTNITNNGNIENETNNTKNENNPPKYQILYYEENSFTPDIRYSPRFARNINYETANNNINNYMGKLQKLYTMTADVVEANNTLADYKIIIMDNIDETRELNNCILSGNCTPTNNQVLALNNYIEDIKSTVFNLRKCNGNLTNELNKISSNNTGISQSIDVTNSNYLRILNQIDTRISFHENAIATLEQIQYLLQEAQNNHQQNDTLVEDLNNNSDIVIDSNIDTFDDNNSSNDSLVDDNTVDNNNSDTIYDDNSINTNIDINDENDSLNQEDNTSTNAVIDNNTNVNDNIENKIIENDIVNNPVENEELNNNEEIIEEYNTDTIINNDTIDNNDSNEVKNTNIDTYQDNLNNLDLMKENNNNDLTVNNTDSNQNIDNTNINDNNINNATDTNLNNEEIISNTNTNNATPQMVDGNIENNGNNNNSIISQNNLDNHNIGNNSYRYDSNGSLYNNTNGYQNDAINNINNKNSNVNTYKYNTLIDSINRGTVDNGINNL